MRFRLRWFAGACAATWAVSVAAQAGTATIEDRARGGGRSGGLFFYVAAIDGRDVPNALDASVGAGRGRGAELVVKAASREVPAGHASLRLRGAQGYAAPIQSIFKTAFGSGVPEVE